MPRKRKPIQMLPRDKSMPIFLNLRCAPHKNIVGGSAKSYTRSVHSVCPLFFALHGVPERLSTTSVSCIASATCLPTFLTYSCISLLNNVSSLGLVYRETALIRFAYAALIFNSLHANILKWE